jgi:hypothetical protein
MPVNIMTAVFPYCKAEKNHFKLKHRYDKENIACE